MKQGEILACVNFWKSKKENKCNGKYCAKCIEKHYNEDMELLKNYHQWTCYSCTRTCLCASCKRKRGTHVAKRKSPSNKGQKKRPRVEYPIESHQHLPSTKKYNTQQVKYDGQQNLHYSNQYLYPSQIGVPMYQQLVPIYVPLEEVNQQQEDQYHNYYQQQEPEPQQVNIKSKISFLIN